MFLKKEKATNSYSVLSRQVNRRSTDLLTTSVFTCGNYSSALKHVQFIVLSFNTYYQYNKKKQQFNSTWVICPLDLLASFVSFFFHLFILPAASRWCLEYFRLECHCFISFESQSLQNQCKFPPAKMSFFCAVLVSVAAAILVTILPRYFKKSLPAIWSGYTAPGWEKVRQVYKWVKWVY